MLLQRVDLKDQCFNKIISNISGGVKKNWTFHKIFKFSPSLDM